MHKEPSEEDEADVPSTFLNKMGDCETEPSDEDTVRAQDHARLRDKCRASKRPWQESQIHVHCEEHEEDVKEFVEWRAQCTVAILRRCVKYS